MPKTCTPRYQVRFVRDAAGVERAQRLRHRCFRGGDGRDADGHDPICTHVLIEETGGRHAVACFRILPLANGAELDRSYSAQFYDLTALRRFALPLLEIGRFCIAPDVSDRADILRLAWGALTRYVDEHQIGMLFGCSSFKGTDVAPYLETFDLLRDRYLAPEKWRPREKAARAFRFADALAGTDGRHRDQKRALSGLPPLLRSYLNMGGWVSDHAVIDADLGTLHVFTGLEIAAVPPARVRLLRAVAAGT